MNVEEALRTPSKGSKTTGPTASPSTASRGSTTATTKKASKNAKITNFFPKVSSPLNRNSSNSNQERSENEQNQIVDELSKDASSSSIKVPTDSLALSETGNNKTKLPHHRDFVFIVPSSDDDTNASKGSVTRRRKPPSLVSSNSKSSDCFILTSTNNELGMEPKRKQAKFGSSLANGPPATIIERIETTSSNNETSASDRAEKIPSRDSKSRDSMPEKRFKADIANLQTANQTSNYNQRINRIQPTKVPRQKMIDFQSVPSDLNLPTEQALSLIERLFLVKMPDDFFQFWDFAKTINHRKPCSAFSHAHLEWTLVGPYDVLSGLIGDFHGFSQEDLMRHCRFFYDPPEFQTVIIKKGTQMTHYGYYRDTPKQEHPIVCMNKASTNGRLHEVGDNLFTLLSNELDASIASLSKASQDIPQLTSTSSKTTRSSKSNEAVNKQSQLEKAKVKQELTIIRDKLIDFCSIHSSNENVSCDSWSHTIARRARKSAKTLSTIGIVVTQVNLGEEESSSGSSSRSSGRNLGDTKLRSILNKIGDCKDEDKSNCPSYRELDQIINNINTATDEPSVLKGLKLGLDLFYYGDIFYHNFIETLCTKAYKSLARPEFLEVLKAHLSDRRRSDKTSLLDL